MGDHKVPLKDRVVLVVFPPSIHGLRLVSLASAAKADAC